MEIGRPSGDDWPAALYAVAIGLMSALIVLQWLQRSCSLARGCGDVAAWHLVAGVAAAFLVPAAVAVVLHRWRPLGGRVGRRLPERAHGQRIAAAAANLSGARLGNASFVDAQMRQETLDGAALRGAGLADAMLYRASFRGADLRRADLSGADLGLADLRGADLRGADLRDARLWEADLRTADLRGAALAGSRWREARTAGARLPEGVSR